VHGVQQQTHYRNNWFMTKDIHLLAFAFSRKKTFHTIKLPNMSESAQPFFKHK
jgi:hypothetical protein